MKTTIKDPKIINLISRAFDSDGYLINPKNRKNIEEARFILASNNYYDELIHGWNVQDCLTIIAYPNKTL